MCSVQFRFLAEIQYFSWLFIMLCNLNQTSVCLFGLPPYVGANQIFYICTVCVWYIGVLYFAIGRLLVQIQLPPEKASGQDPFSQTLSASQCINVFPFVRTNG